MSDLVIVAFTVTGILAQIPLEAQMGANNDELQIGYVP
jgi:hypothetical protein